MQVNYFDVDYFKLSDGVVEVMGVLGLYHHAQRALLCLFMNTIFQ